MPGAKSQDAFRDTARIGSRKTHDTYRRSGQVAWK